MGPRSTETLTAAKQLLDQPEMRDLNPTDVTSAVLFMVIARDEIPYDASTFVKALKDHRAGQRIDWQDVITSFDRQQLTITKEQFKKIYDALLPMAQTKDNVDIQTLWGGEWRNELPQLSFVAGFLSHSHDEIDATKIPHLRPAFTSEDFADAPAEARDYAREALRHPYASFEASKALMRLAFETHAVYDNALRCLIIERAVNTNLALFVGSASSVPQPWTSVQDMAIKTLFEKIMMLIAKDSVSDTGSECHFALHLLWRNHKAWVAATISKFYQKYPLRLGTILEIAHHHGMLLDLIEAKNELSLDLAALAHGRSMFDLDTWLQQIVSEMGSETITPALCQFLTGKITDDVATHKENLEPQTFPLRVRTAHSILTFLGRQNLPEVERIEIQRSAIMAYPRLINYDQGVDDVIDANGAADNALAPEADAKMQEYFRMMWNGEQGVQDIINVLRRLKTSRDSTEQDLFACMIYGLFDEYHCFAQYPQKALADTAVLFGSIIDFKLLSNVALQVAISMVLESVREHRPDDLMFKFGLQALVRFEARLEEWSRLCETLLEIPGLKDTEIYPLLEDVSRRRQDDTDHPEDNKVNGDAADDFLAPDPGVAEFSCISVDPLPTDDEANDPDDALQEVVLFIFNNVAERNVAEKTDDLRTKIQPEHHQWLAKFLVENRIKSQPNFQPLYMSILERFNEPTLWSAVLSATYAIVIRMLNAEATMNASNERTQLKQLAGWLGSMTLARNQSIKHRNISFKHLLIEAQDTQRLLVVIPFTCKVLSSVAQSVVFRPPCAWTMEIVEILVELYHFTDLKLNLKFEIEVLCKNLSLDYKEVEPATVIRSRPSINQDSMPTATADGLDAFNDPSMLNFNRRLADRFSPTAIITQELASVLKHNYQATGGDIQVQEQVRSLLTDATERAVADIIGAVVERSVTIASIAACQITMKDFALESDVEQLSDSAHTAVRSLAGSLASVTSKEPLRNQMMNNVVALRNTIPEHLLTPGAMQMFVHDNLDNVCGMVEKAAAEASVEEIDLQFEENGAIRDRQAPGFGQTSQVSKYANFIPPPYKMSLGGLTQEQIAIYKDFERSTRASISQNVDISQENGRHLPDMFQDQFVPTFGSDTTLESSAPHRGPTESVARPSAMVNGYSPSATSTEERIVESSKELYQAVVEAEQDGYELAIDAPSVRQAWGTLVEDLRIGGPQLMSSASIIAARELSHYLYSGRNSFKSLEAMATFLRQICSLAETTEEVFMNWCNDFNGCTRFDANVTAALLKADLVDLHRLDLIIAAGMLKKKKKEDEDDDDIPGMISSFSGLLDITLLADPPTIYRSDFAHSINALARCVSLEKYADQTQAIVNKLGGLALSSSASDTGGDEEGQMSYVFDEWVRLQEKVNDSSVATSFVQQLHDQHAFTNQETLVSFMRASVRSCVTAYSQGESQGYLGIQAPLTKCDALAKLIVLMMDVESKTNGAMKTDNVDVLDLSGTILVMTLAQYVKQGLGAVSQRPFFRIFSTLFFELQDRRSMLQYAAQDTSMLALAERLLLVVPGQFPALAFSWLSLISHRVFTPTLILHLGTAGTDMYCRLLSAQIAYVSDMVPLMDTSPAARDLYRGTLKLLLVLHHDFPDFIADYAFQLLKHLPPFCSQMRSLIVSASPTTLSELPDPFTGGLRIERLGDAKEPPSMTGDHDRAITDAGLDDVLNAYYKRSGSTDSHVETVIRALVSGVDFRAGAIEPINIDLADALLITLPARRTEGQPWLFFSEDNKTAVLLNDVILGLDTKPRYYFLSAMANHLRFPNSFTAFYSQMFINFFRSKKIEDPHVQQQALRVLMERIVVHRPHSWGLIVTLVELLKSRNYRVFDLPIVKSAPEVCLASASIQAICKD